MTTTKIEILLYSFNRGVLLKRKRREELVYDLGVGEKQSDKIEMDFLCIRNK